MKLTSGDLTDRQRDILAKVEAGWYLDRAGKDGLGGWLFTDTRKGHAVSVNDMSALIGGMHIGWNPHIETFVVRNHAGKGGSS